MNVRVEQRKQKRTQCSQTVPVQEQRQVLVDLRDQSPNVQQDLVECGAAPWTPRIPEAPNVDQVHHQSLHAQMVGNLHPIFDVGIPR